LEKILYAVVTGLTCINPPIEMALPLILAPLYLIGFAGLNHNSFFKENENLLSIAFSLRNFYANFLNPVSRPSTRQYTIIGGIKL
jgi:hypothetical protein